MAGTITGTMTQPAMWEWRWSNNTTSSTLADVILYPYFGTKKFLETPLFYRCTVLCGLTPLPTILVILLNTMSGFPPTTPSAKEGAYHVVATASRRTWPDNHICLFAILIGMLLSLKVGRVC